MGGQYSAQVYITLRPSVLDPAGAAVQVGLVNLGYDMVSQVRIGKYIQLTLEAPSLELAHREVDRACSQLLANPVIEDYRFDLTAS